MKRSPTPQPRTLFSPALGLIAPNRIAAAHSGTESYAYVVVHGNTVTGNVQFPVPDLNKTLGLEIATDEAGVDAGVAAHLERITAYAAEHFRLSDTSGAWNLRFVGHRVLVRSIGSYAILEYVVDRHFDPVPTTFAIDFDAIIESNHHHKALVLVKRHAGIGPLDADDEQRLEFSTESTHHQVTIAPASWQSDVTTAASVVTTTAKQYLRRAKKRIKG